MLYFDALVIDLGAEAPVPITVSARDYYRSVVEVVFAETADVLGGRTLGQTVPIPVSALALDSHQVGRMLLAGLRRVPNAAAAVVIDFRPPTSRVVRGVVLDSLSTALRNWFAHRSLENEGTLLVLADGIPLHWREVFSQMIDLGSVILLDRSRAPASEAVVGATLSLTDQASISGVLAEAIPDPLEELKLRMIRHRGRFQLSLNNAGEIADCVYDGAYCDRSLISLIGDFIDRTAVTSSNAVVVGLRAVLPWFGRAVRAAAAERAINYYIEGEEGSKKLTNFLEENAVEQVVLVIPYLNHGDGLRQMVQLIPDKMSIHPFAILSASSSDERSELGSQSVETSRGLLTVPFLLQRPHRLSWAAELSSFGVDPVPLECNLSPRLSGREFWTAITSTGLLETELNDPGGRVPLQNVPDFRSLLEEDLPWISYRLSRLIESVVKADPEELVVFLPREPERGASESLAYFFETVLGATVVQVPRATINKAKGAGSYVELRAGVDGGVSSWFSSLRTAARPRVVILDEFRLSGGTTENLAKLISLADVAPLGAFVILDLAPHLVSTVPTHSLYSWRSGAT